MRRKVFGYKKTLEYLQKGYAICCPPLSGEYMVIGNDEFVTIRCDVLGKLLFNNLVKDGSRVDTWTRTYIIK